MSTNSKRNNVSKHKYDLVYIFVDMVLTLDNSPVLQSQVVEKIINQCKAGMKISVVTTIHDNKRFIKLIQNPLKKFDVDIYAFQHQGLIKSIWRASQIIKRHFTNSDIAHVYARGIWDVLVYRLAFPFIRPPLIYDFRGDLVAESEARGSSKYRLILLKILCRAALSNASVVLTVSNASKKLLKTEYKCKNIYVLPCAVDFNIYDRDLKKRMVIRKELNILSTDIVLIYAGGLADYQMIPEMLKIWSKLAQVRRIRFILLTSKQPTARGKLPKLTLIDQIPGLIHTSVSRSEVWSYLVAADIGFMLREQHKLNAVASPVKFGEYIASGLSIVSSPGIGDISQLIVENNLGILVNPNDTESAVAACVELTDSIAEDRHVFRKRAINVGRRENWDLQTHKYIWRKILCTNEFSQFRN